MSTIAKLLVSLGIDSREYSQGLDSATQKTSAFGSVVKSAAGFAVVGFAAIGGAAVGAGIVGLKFNNTMEQVTAQLNAFTKDGKKSAEILEMIKDRASKTPFEFEEMAKATASLLPAAKQSGKGLEDLVGLAEILAASNPAQGLEGAAFALKEALGGDFVSIVERFNLPRQRLKELKDQGVPAMEAVQIAMKEMGLDADLVSNMANTASGRWSTFKDTMVGVAATVTKPLFDMLSGSLARVNDTIAANQPLIDAFANTLATNVTSAIQTVIGVGSSLVNIVQLLQTGDFQGGIFGLHEDSPFITALFVAREAANNLINTVQSLASGGINLDIFGPLVESAQNRITVLIEIVNGVFGVINSVIDTYGNRIATSASTAFTAILTTISAVLAGVNNVVNAVLGQVATFIQANGQDIANFIAETWLSIADIVKLAMDLINATVVPILQGIAAFINTHSSEIQTVLGAAWNIIKVVITTALDLIKSVITIALQAINGDWAGAWETLKGFSARFVTALLEVFKNGLTIIQNAFNTAIDAIKTIWNGLVGNSFKIGTDIINGILDGLKSAANGLLNWLGNLASQALHTAKSAIQARSPSKKFADQVGVPIITGIIQGMESVSGMLTGSLETLAGGAVETVKSGVQKLGNLIQESPLPTLAEKLGANTLSGFMAGVKANMSAATGAVRDAANDLLGAATAELDIHSPSGRFAREVGIPVVLGIVQGLEQTWPLATQWLKGNLAKLTGEYLKTSAQMVRGNYNIFKSLRDLEKVEPYQPLIDASQNYQNASKHAIEVAGKLLDVNSQIDQLIAGGPGDLANHVKYNEQLMKLYGTQAQLLQDQATSQSDLVRLFAKQEQAQVVSMQQQRTIQSIAERARQAYQTMQQQALSMMKVDAKGALEFFNQRKSQIEELSKLEKEHALSDDPEDRAALETQIALLKAAQAAEQTAQAVQININTRSQEQSDQNIINIIQRALQAAGIQVDIRTRVGP